MSEAAIYARLSDTRGEADGIERQLRELHAHAERLGVQVVEELVDNDLSAAKKKRRPAYERLMVGIEANEWQVVIVRNLDRWVRRPAELERIIEVVERSSVQVESIHGQIDLRSRSGRLSARVVTAVNMAEVEAIQERVTDWHADRASQGMPLHGPPGFGFRRSKGQRDVEVDPEAAEQIRDAAARVLAGESVRSIARAWGRHPSFVTRALLAPRTAGLRIHDGVEVKASWPAIVEVDVWRQVGKLLRQPSRRKQTSTTAHLLTGLARCGPCGKTLNSKVVQGERRYYCRHCHAVTVFAVRLEQHVVSELFDGIDRLRLDRALHDTTADQSDLVSLLDQLDNLKAERDSLAAELGAGGMTLGEWKVVRAGLDDREAAVRAKLERHRGGAALAALVDVNIRSEWGGFTLAEQRRVLDVFLADVVVDRAVRGRNRFDPARVDVRWAV